MVDFTSDDNPYKLSDGISGSNSLGSGGGSEWDFIVKESQKGAALEFNVDGESTSMSVGDYLAAVNAQGAQKVREADRKRKAAIKRAAEKKKYLMYLAAGGAGILLLRSL